MEIIRDKGIEKAKVYEKIFNGLSFFNWWFNIFPKQKIEIAEEKIRKYLV